MAIKRQRLQRKPIHNHSDGTVIDLQLGWKFTVQSTNHGSLDFDFTPMRANNREDLASHMRDALWSLRHESEGVSLESYYSAIRRFWKFLSECQADEFTRLDQIDRQCLIRYLAWLELQLVPPGHANSGHKISVSASRNAYSGLKTLLVNRQKLAPLNISKQLTFPLNPFPRSNQQGQKRAPYSDAEHKSILQALNADLRKIHQNSDSGLPSLQVLIVHLLVLASSTGANLQPLLELKRNSLQSHPLDDRELLFTSKRRGWSSFAISSRRPQNQPDATKNIHTVPASIGDHFKALCAITAPLADQVQPFMRDFAFLWSVSRGTRKGDIIRLSRLEAKTGIRDFATRHKLRDDEGNPMALSFSRFRPTYATDLYRRTRDIRKVSNALGHASIETTARYYVELGGDAIRDHTLVTEGMVSRFTSLNVEGKVVLAADGRIPSTEIKFLARDGYSTGIAHCRNPFREEEDVCKKFFTCFKCPNMLVFEDDLWRLFSFYFRLLAERTKVRPDHWLKTYGPIVRRIDHDIAPQFDDELVTIAKDRARTNPHPAWKEPLR